MKFKDLDRNIKIRLVGEFAVSTSFWMFFPFLTIYFTETLGTAITGILLVLSQVLSALTGLLGGYFADRYGRKYMMVTALCIQSFFLFLFALSNTEMINMPLLGFVLYSCVGMAWGLFSPASQAMVTDVVAEEDRTHVFALIYTITNISVVIGPLLGGFLFDDYLVQLLLISSLIMLMIAFVMKVKLAETINTSKEDTVSHVPWFKVIPQQIKSYKIIFSDKIFFLFILAGILIAQTFMQLDILIPVFIRGNMTNTMTVTILKEEFVISSNNVVGLLFAENGFLVITLTLIVSSMLKRFTDRNIFFISSIFYAFSMIYLAYTDQIAQLFFAIFIFTFAELMTAGMQQKFISRIAPKDKRGQYFAASSLQYSVGRAIAPLAINLTAIIGFMATLYVCALLALVAGMIYVLVFNMEGKRGKVVAQGEKLTKFKSPYEW